MPGNEVGDRIHNFFAQENLSQGQHHSETANWTGLGDTSWVGGQQQIGTPYTSNFKNQSDAERGYGEQSSTVLHGINFMHQFARSNSQNQQLNANGHIHGNQSFQANESDGNLLGVDIDTDRRNLTSRGFSVLDSQSGSGPEMYKKNLLRMGSNDTPINYDFLGRQQHMSNQHSGMLQSLSRQQSGINDMQFLQQQVMLKQMQELQRQQHHQKQQFQQPELRQLGSANQVSSLAKQAAGGHPSAMVNGVPIHDASSYSWQSEHMPTNSNWSQRIASPAMQGSSSGLILAPEQGQAPRLMGMMPQQLDQSLHGVPVSGIRSSPNQFSPVQMDKPTLQPMSGSSNSFVGNHYAGFTNNAGMSDDTLVARQGYQGKHVGSADTQDLNGAHNSGNFRQVDARQSNGPSQYLHRRQDSRGSLDSAPEKTAMQVDPSQNVATLDPTEEKILFGSDDNLWEAFGRSPIVTSGGYMSDGGDVFGSFPSMQNGSWSALMQSAVAETFSDDVGVQEEWSGLSGNQSSSNANDTVKQQSTWADIRLQSSSVSNARPYGISDLSNSIVSYNGRPEFKQSGVSPSNETTDMINNGSSQRYVQPFSGPGTQWLDQKIVQKPLPDDVNNYGKNVRLPVAGESRKSVSGSWMNQQSISSSNMGGQPSMPNGWKFIDSVSPGSVGDSACLQKTDSVSNSLVLEQARSRTGSPQVNREESSSNMYTESKAGRLHPERIANGNNIGTLDHSDTKDKKTNSFRDVGPYSSSSGARENAWLDSSGSFTVSGVKGKPSSIVQKPSGIRKFQYHPMGDLEVDVEPYGQSMQTHVSPGLKGQDNGGIRQPNFPSEAARNSLEIGKGHYRGFQGDGKGLDESASKNVVSGFASDKTTQPSQHMLELLHKVDQPGDHGNATKYSSSDCNQLSEIHGISNSNSSNHLHQNEPATSQGFGLQLGPPAQIMPAQNRPVSSRSSSEVGEEGHPLLASTSPVQGLPLSHETSQGELRSTKSGTFGINIKNTQGGNTAMDISPGFPYPRIHLQTQHTNDAGGQSESVNVFFDRLSSHSKQASQSFTSTPDMSGSTLRSREAASGEMRYLSNHLPNDGKDSAPHFPVLESVNVNGDSTLSGALQESSAKMAPNMWSNASTRQPSFNAQHSRVQYLASKSNNDEDTKSSRPHELEAQNLQMIGNVQSETGGNAVSSHGFTGKEQPAEGDSSSNISAGNDPVQNTSTVMRGADSAAACVPGTSISNPTSHTQREIEAFGRSLRPNNFLHQSYSLMHQVRGNKNTEVDLSNRSSKRFKGPDHCLDVHGVGQQSYDLNNMARNVSTTHGVKPTDFQDANMPSQDVESFGRNDSQNYSNSSVVSVRTEHSKISPQMAPSWFDLYGTFKNMPISPLADSRKIASVMTSNFPSNVGRPASSLCGSSLVEQGNTVGADIGQHGFLPKSSTPASHASEDLSSQITNPNVADACLTVTRTKKRKTATSQLVPWNKQLVDGLSVFQNISSAESDWALAVNRLTEKVEGGKELADDGPPVYRSKRRLIITTQLMQMLLSPPEASVLSGDAMSHYESVVHFLARSTVGDTCSTLSCAGNDVFVPSSCGNNLPEKQNRSERNSEQHYSKVVEDLITRARKLENDLLRLDRRASVLDLRVECQELEKYSVINRFAKFHGRAQADATEMSSPDAPSIAQKSALLRYVTAVPMPKNLPDGVQCLSL